jgi:hypothetical protein
MPNRRCPASHRSEATISTANEVTGCLREYIDTTTGVPQRAAHSLHRTKSATQGHKETSSQFGHRLCRLAGKIDEELRRRAYGTIFQGRNRHRPPGGRQFDGQTFDC